MYNSLDLALFLIVTNCNLILTFLRFHLMKKDSSEFLLLIKITFASG